MNYQKFYLKYIIEYTKEKNSLHLFIYNNKCEGGCLKRAPLANTFSQTYKFLPEKYIWNKILGKFRSFKARNTYKVVRII